MQDFKDCLIFSAVIVAIISLVYVKTWAPEGVSSLKVTHVYEDGCIDLYDNKTATYKFYCEEEF